MKMKFANQIILLLSACFILNACKKEGFPVPPASTVPLFSYTIDNNGFAPASITFTNESIVPETVGIPSYFWNFGDGKSSTEVNPVHLFSSPGIYPVKLVVTTSVSFEIRELAKNIIIKDINETGTPVYFTDGSVVYNSMLNSSTAQPIFASLPVGALDDSYGITFDTVNFKLYISDLDAGKIYMCDPDGLNFLEFKTGLSGPGGMAIDYAGNKLYWSTDDGIQRADISGTDVNQKEDFVTGKTTDDPEGIAIDPINSKLYWSTYEDAGVWVKNLDGTGENNLLPGVGGGSIIIAGNRIFFDHWIASKDIYLKSANLDGTDVRTLATGISRLVYGLAYEPTSNKVYWGDRDVDKIKRSNLDGSGMETWYESPDISPRGIVFGKKK